MEPASELFTFLTEYSEKHSPLDFMLVLKHWDLFLRGVGNTVALLVFPLTLSTIIAVPLAIIRAQRVPVLNGMISGYIYLFRGTPLLVQLYLLYYGVAQFEFIRQSFLWPLLREPWWCAFISFTLCAAAYTAEIFRGGIESVPFGEVEAAKACGMSHLQRLRRIVLPSAFRTSLPAFSNEVIFNLHSTVIASTVTIVDILGAGRQFNNRYYVAFEGFIAAAVLYMILVYLLTRGFKLWENRWHRHLRPSDA